MNDPATSLERIAPILGRVPSGIFILTVKNGEQETGMLASWVQQAGFEPPMLTLAVKKGRYVADWLQRGLPFALNLVGAGHGGLVKHFAKGFDPGAPAFEGLEIDRNEAGVPLLHGTVGWLECEPAGSLESGDHHVFLARVADGQFRENDKPMIHIRRDGMKY